MSLSGPPSESQCCNRGELGRKLADAQLEVLHLNEFLKQNTQKYTEDIKKLEEKVWWQSGLLGSASLLQEESASGWKYIRSSFDTFIAEH